MSKFPISITAALFTLSLALMVHDTAGVNETLSQEDIQYLVASRPVLYDMFGKPIQANDAQYENAVKNGAKIKDGASIPFISPRGEVVAVTPLGIPEAYLTGWKIEPLEHQADRLLETKQLNSMWLTDWPGLFFHVLLCQFTAILFLGAFFLVKANPPKKNLFAHLGYK